MADTNERATTIRMAKMLATMVAIATNMDLDARKWNVLNKTAIATDPNVAKRTDHATFVREMAGRFFSDLKFWKESLALLQPYYNEKLVDVTFYLRRETVPSVPGSNVNANVSINHAAIMDNLVADLESGKISAEEFAAKTDALKMKF